MWRVDDHQLVHQMRHLIGQIPGHSATPVVGNQSGELTLVARGFELNQGGNVVHQMLGPVGADLGGRA